MTVSAIAQFTITDATRTCTISPVSQTFSRVSTAPCSLLAADESPAVEEGSWPYQKVVLSAFPDEAAVRAFADSPEYAAITADRRATEGPDLRASC